ncbi:hypothetical protein K501DRAFT_272671 [Backusella circina FSU 941]|nr:hypothetical protein K501DRAFT_272671 [Backusella circina FSU 941]
MSGIPKVLTIAGSDSGGGAGIQADIKTLTSMHVYATSVITSVTSQNTKGVDGIHDIPPEFVAKQLQAVLSDIGTDAIKIGMLSSSDIIVTIAGILSSNEQPYKVVLDPVMVSTSGSRLLAEDAIQSLIEHLLPITHILTPNVPEAELLLGMERGSIRTIQDMCDTAKKLTTLGPTLVLLKGGHLPLDINGDKKVVDVIYNSETGVYREVENDYVNTKNTHGTGCTLSAALAGELAKGLTDENACVRAIHYVNDAIAKPLGQIGQGNGPINHFHRMRWSPYEGQPFIDAVKSSLPPNLWSDFIDHPFVLGIKDGTLPIESFVYYLKQDYLYLQHYARAAALAAYKSHDMRSIGDNASIVVHIAKESELHIEYCARFGVTKEDILSTPESVFNSAYTRFVLDKGATGDMLDLKMAMAPCLLGYGEIGLKLFNDPTTKREGNPYWEWICQYAADDYQDAVTRGLAEMETLSQHSVSTSVSRFHDVCKTFEQATRLEIMFWEMGLHRN